MSSGARELPARSVSSAQCLIREGYTVGRTIGEGSYCRVKEISKGQERYAVKIIAKNQTSSDFVNRFLPRELDILPRIEHPNIVKVYRILQAREKVFIIMELAEHGDLLDHIRNHGRISEDRARRYFGQLASALNYLHAKNIAHRDLKCENVLLKDENTVKLTDFGFSRFCHDPSGKRVLSSTYCGSAAYASPEVLQGIPYNPKMYDVWSLGCILFIMVTGTMPFDDTNIKTQIRLQMHRDVRFPPNYSISSSCKSLIRHMLEPDIVKRATLKQVMRHQWLEEGVAVAS
ncbi:testis-specific serine/threonine-protein kinase 1-like [Dermacentor albipictus]|uniref:testis-specific serine/threonine-protein kinase 1-like n=1 Tax=Dermacentor albipictus TaxID=60249 RepID=UPI0031FE32E8